MVTDRDEPFHAAEIVREKLTLKLREELPYGINVQIERFADEDNRIMINAVIWVERAGQKAIVIGQGGERLKEIGRAGPHRTQRSVAALRASGAVGQGQGKLGGQRDGAAPIWIRHLVKSRPAVRRRAAYGWQPAYVLHQYAYRDTSRIVEVFTARAWPAHAVRARRQRPEVRVCKAAAAAVPAACCVSWSGTAEACQLVTAEIDGPITTSRRNGS